MTALLRTRKAIVPPVRGRLWLLADLLLLLFASGPLLAPAFAATPIWPFPWIAERIIYPLGLFVCPEDSMLPHWEGHLLAVCSRCYAAIIGLVAMRLAVAGSTPLADLLARLPRRALYPAALATVVIWQFDLWAMNRGYWSHAHHEEIAMGLPLGLAIGLIVYTAVARLTGRALPWDCRVSPVE